MLSAETLGISPYRHTILQQVADLLEREQLKLDMGTSCSLESAEEEVEQVEACGTHACIGGWMAILERNGGKLPRYITREDEQTAYQVVLREVGDNGLHPLHDLFYDTLNSGVTPAQGAQAIRNFLHTGNPDWDSVLAGH